jgi:lysozyme
VIYTSPSFWKNYLGDRFSNYPLWLAEYSNVAKPPPNTPNWIFWQYSQKGSVAGVDGLVDSDRSIGAKYTDYLCTKGDAE